MKGKRIQYAGAWGVAALLAIAGFATSQRAVSAQGRGAAGAAPSYRVVPLWPRPFPDDSWVIGSITGVAVDSTNHVWLAHRGFDSLQGNEKGMSLNPPSSSVCCMPAPFVIEYDQNGNLVQSWGGPSQNYAWPQATGGIAVDAKGNVWITAAGPEPPPPAAGRRGAPPAQPAGAAPPAGAPPPPPPPARGAPPAGRGAAAAPAAPPADAHVLKFGRDGRYLMTIGTPGKMDGPDSQNTLNRPAGVAVDDAANEVYVADSGNHRIVVFDANTGAYKRHWFAFGEKTAGAAAGDYDPAAPPARSFRDVTCVKIAKDGNVYVCDRSSDRIQVFDKTGKFIKEQIVAKDTKGSTVALGAGANMTVSAHGSVWDVAFSSDPAQRWLYVVDGTNMKVHILSRDTLAEAGSFGSGGRYPGQMLVPDAIATDAQGNVYTGEGHHGKRIQKWVAAR